MSDASQSQIPLRMHIVGQNMLNGEEKKGYCDILLLVSSYSDMLESINQFRTSGLVRHSALIITDALSTYPNTTINTLIDSLCCHIVKIFTMIPLASLFIKKNILPPILFPHRRISIASNGIFVSLLCQICPRMFPPLVTNRYHQYLSLHPIT